MPYLVQYSESLLSKYLWIFSKGEPIRLCQNLGFLDMGKIHYVFWLFWAYGWLLNATVADYQNAPSELYIFTGRFISFDNTVETLGFFITTLISYLIATDSPLLKDNDTEKKEEAKE